MSAHCQVTGRRPGFGKYYLTSEGRRVTLRVSAKGIKVIDRDGIEAVVARLRRSGEKI
jgi:large subunit ribosomal protein L28